MRGRKRSELEERRLKPAKAPKIEEWRLQPVKEQRIQPGIDTSVGVQSQRMHDASLPNPLKRRFQVEADEA